MPNVTAVSPIRAFVGRASQFVADVAQGKSWVESGIRWLGLPDTSRMVYLTGRSTPDADQLNIHTVALTSIYAFAAMEWRAERLAQAPLFVSRLRADGREEWDRNNPLSKLFAFPRPDMRMAEILSLTQKYWDGTGAALWYLQRSQTLGILRIVPLSRWEFKVESDGDLIFGNYQVRLNGKWESVKREDVVHFRDLSGQSWYEPTSRLEVALQNLNLGHSVTKMLSRYMMKAMFPGGVVSPDPDWNPSEPDWEKYKAAIRAWHGGPANAGEPLVVKGGTQFSKAALGMQDLVPAEILDRVEANVGSAFGIPPIVLGWVVGLRNSPWSQAEQMDRQAYQGTGKSLWDRTAATITHAMLTRDEIMSGLSVKFDLSGVSQLKPDEERNARIAALNSNIWKLDESREFTGKEPIGGEEGDTIVAELSMRSALGGFGSGGDGTDEDDEVEEGDEDEDENAEKAVRLFKHAPRRARKFFAKLSKRVQTKAVWAEFDSGTKASEPMWERAVYAELQRQRAETMTLARTTLEAKNVNRDSADEFQLSFDKLMKEARPRMKAIAQPLLISTGGKAVRSLSVRIDVTFDLLQPGLFGYAAREADFLARVMGETTGDLVAKAVQAGLEDGDTVARMVERLGNLPAFSTDRAKLVARTETTRAWNGAQRASLSQYEKDSGRVAFKTWLSSQDDRVRLEHQELDGEQRPIDEKFTNGLQEPGEPNCRCTLTYAVTDPIGGN